MAAWTRCDRCRKVKQGEEFDDDSPTCRACLTSPVKVPAKTRAGGVTTRRVAPKTAGPPQVGPRPALVGIAGSGDLEVRERRARRAALDQLAEAHAGDFEQLLEAARRTEGLRA